MTSNKRGAGSDKRKILPVFVIQTILFPSTFLKKIGKSIKDLKLPESTSEETKYLALKGDTSAVGGPVNLWTVGTICSLQKNNKDEYYLSGESRAEAVKIWRDPKDGLVASIKELEDEPPIEEITEAEEPMLFGCVESIRRLLKKWQEKIPESEAELYKKISEQISAIKAVRREKDIIYSLPWHVLVNFYDFFSFDFKEEMLRTNKVIDRLQSVAEKLQREISAFQYAGSFADADIENPIKLGNNTSDK